MSDLVNDAKERLTLKQARAWEIAEHLGALSRGAGEPQKSENRGGPDHVVVCVDGFTFIRAFYHEGEEAFELWPNGQKKVLNVHREREGTRFKILSFKRGDWEDQLLGLLPAEGGAS